MGVAAGILGVLGLCSVLVGIPKFKPELFFGGGAASLIAVVLAVLATGGAATAGLVCGTIGALIFAVVLLFFTMVKPGK